MIQIGRILSVKNGMAYMEVSRKGACGSACATCSSSACESKSEFISVPNDLNAKEGDSVELFVNDHFVLNSIYKVYGIPLVFFLLAIGLGQLLLPDALPKRDLYFALSIFVSPAVTMSIGSPSNENDIVFAILPSSQPRAFAARATVALDSSISITRSSIPSFLKYSLTLSIDIEFPPNAKAAGSTVRLLIFCYLRLFLLLTPSVTLSSGALNAASLIIRMMSIAARAEQA